MIKTLVDVGNKKKENELKLHKPKINYLDLPSLLY